MFQEFQISVTPLKNRADEYLIKTEAVAPGVPLATERVSLPVEAWLGQVRQAMSNSLLQLSEENEDGLIDLGGAPASLGHYPEKALMLTSLGKQLFQGLFQGSLRTSWLIAQRIANQHQAMVRLRLILKDQRLNRLPWEALSTGEQPLATGVDITFSRYLFNPGTKHPVSLNLPRLHHPVRVLIVIAGPNDQATRVWQQAAAHWQAELDTSELKLHLLTQPGRESLMQALTQRQYHIFHYVGHSDLRDAGKDLYWINHQTGLMEIIAGDDLGALLHNQGIQLAVFNRCWSADPELATAATQILTQILLKQELPAVLSMATPIPNEVALTLTRLFYHHLSQGCPLDLSLSRARQGLIAADGLDQFDQLSWVQPVLYLHPDWDGAILPPQPAQPELWQPEAVLTSEDQALIGEDGDGEALEVETDFVPQGEGEDDTAAFIQGVLAQLAAEETESLSATPNQNPASKLTQLRVKDTKKVAAVEETGIFLKQDATLLERWRRLPKFPLFGVATVVAITLFSVVLRFDPNPQVPEPPDSATEFDESPHLPLEAKVTTATLYQIARQNIKANKLEVGLAAVTALLNRGALPYAEEALEAVAVSQLDTPDVAFLRGRLFWQYYLQGYEDFKADDARRAWQVSVAAQPQIKSLNALGFAYYAEGNYQQANDAWYDALELAEVLAVDHPEILQSPEVLTTYAGLALVLRQLAQEQSQRQAEILQEKAVKIYNMVMQTAPLQFSQASLLERWLWSEEAIATWENF